ncbi:MarR family winged helix-turn-helix transcriptional regulator [Actinokineospora soli]|uniref:MarR family winged helix-turn-helix transcriptional regulator n=1 Tax=Actinokineospora soli TaxID=1048753 RepID=A0ABW2TLX2_9PSEU
MDDLDPRLHTVRLLRTIAARLDLLDARFAAEHDLHPTDLRALIHLLEARRAGVPATPGWLCGRLGLNSASVTALVDRLVRAGLVTRARDDHDRRRVLLSVHERAVDLGGLAVDDTTRDAISALDRCDPADLLAARRVLYEIARSMSGERPRNPVVPSGQSEAWTRSNQPTPSAR